MGDIADDLMDAEMLYPDLDPLDAYDAYLNDLALSADRVTENDAKDKKGKRPKKKGKHGKPKAP